MRTIFLPNGAWSYDPARRLGRPGGFGEVFEGVDPAGGPVAVKRLYVNQAQAGHRELRIAAELTGHDYQHVIQIFDSGADTNSGEYFVVMARAERSLADVASAGSVPEAEAVNILIQIVNGLEEIDQLIHRDLKPENVLSHGGRWKIADLGIARFVEESTSLNTLKECLSPLYAAPEQWELAPASKQTDVYALGCILYALITGAPPFAGTSVPELREKHLKAAPSRLPGSARLAQLASMCLRKVPVGRPDLPSVRRQLQAVIEAMAVPRHDQLAAAAAMIADEMAQRESEESRRRREDTARRQLAQEATVALQEIFSELNQAVRSAAPVARFNHSRHGGGQIALGQGTLAWDVLFPYVEEFITI